MGEGVEVLERKCDKGAYENRSTIPFNSKGVRRKTRIRVRTRTARCHGVVHRHCMRDVDLTTIEAAYSSGIGRRGASDPLVFGNQGSRRGGGEIS